MILGLARVSMPSSANQPPKTKSRWTRAACELQHPRQTKKLPACPRLPASKFVSSNLRPYSHWMAIETLSDFLTLLEREGELAKISAPVDPKLEIAAICDRVSKTPAPHGNQELDRSPAA